MSEKRDRIAAAVTLSKVDDLTAIFARIDISDLEDDEGARQVMAALKRWRSRLYRAVYAVPSPDDGQQTKGADE